ncbi:uncharacterized protein F5147DRAFT_652922 [Suillus discolor]|uniref:Uncharacterized protein n=1 Tax=Suillus discolor TaxID=1912936 RepID=A0A9P7F866_9AGAM|nr:uncharacterized protein F5147DRAFT_652922 [Suillus discolor]KAG2108200.1 hypothetical protein F5147DRAFT_652922 [Suillus discolor]
MSDISSEWSSYCDHMFHQLNTFHPLPEISEPLIPPPPKLDIPTIITCAQLVFLLAEAYQNPSMNNVHKKLLWARFPPAERMLLTRPLIVLDSGYRIIIWYIPEALHGYIQSDMYTATLRMSHHLQKSVIRGASQWRTNGANFHATDGTDVTPKCINIAPCWFQQGRECQGTPPENTWDGFMPEVLATLKGERGMSMILEMQRSRLLASTAMRVMHPQKY